MVVVRTIIGIVQYFLFAGIIIYFVHIVVQGFKRKKYGRYIDPEEEERMRQEEERMRQEEERLQQEEEKLWL